MGSAGAENICASASVRAFQIAGGLLLLNEKSGRLLALNDTASFLWDLLLTSESVSQEYLSSELAREWGICRTRAHSDVGSILAQWHSHGVLAESEDLSQPSVRQPTDWGKANFPRWNAEWTCAIGGRTIAFVSEDDPPWPMRQLLESFETRDARPDVRIEFRRTPEHETAILCDGVERIRSRSTGMLLGCTWQMILECIHRHNGWLALIHGAVVVRRGMGIALCGPSGSGKTTLTAGLNNAGFNYFADDLVAVTAPDGMVLPWPLPLGIKSGSVDVLTPLYPDLKQARQYRAKGVHARLLHPSPPMWDADPVPLRTLVFPRFSKGAAPSLRHASTFQAAEHLLTDRIWIGNPISADRVAAFVDWLGRIEAYSCEFGSLDAGIRMIKELAP